MSQYQRHANNHVNFTHLMYFSLVTFHFLRAIEVLKTMKNVNHDMSYQIDKLHETKCILEKSLNLPSHRIHISI